MARPVKGRIAPRALAAAANRPTVRAMHHSRTDPEAEPPGLGELFMTFATRLNPLWMLLAGGVRGFSAIV